MEEKIHRKPMQLDKDIEKSPTFKEQAKLSKGNREKNQCARIPSEILWKFQEGLESHTLLETINKGKKLMQEDPTYTPSIVLPYEGLSLLFTNLECKKESLKHCKTF